MEGVGEVIHSDRPHRYGVIVEFSCDNGLDFDLILGEVEAAVINCAPNIYDVSTCEMEESEL